MAANLDYRIYEGDDRAAIAAEWQAEVERDRHDNGHSYSGGVGMLGAEIKWRPTAVATEQEAEQYLAETHQKWSGPIAVRFGDRWMIGGWCAS